MVRLIPSIYLPEQKPLNLLYKPGRYKPFAGTLSWPLAMRRALKSASYITGLYAHGSPW